MDTWQAIDDGSSEQAGRLLARACGASRWVARMLTRRPFGSRERLLSSALEEWNALDEDDWREAFAHHPKIGDRAALAARFPATHDLSAREQAGVAGASEDVLDALATANRLYESRFGYIFIVCATGLSAEEMLDRQRLLVYRENVGMEVKLQRQIVRMRIAHVQSEAGCIVA